MSNNGHCKFTKRLYTTGYCPIADSKCEVGFFEICPFKVEPEITEGLITSSEPIKQNVPNYCNICFNSRVYEEPEDDYFSTPLTDDNDLSYHGIRDRGDAADGRRIMIASGGGKPLRIQFDEWFEKGRRWITSAEYYPKYCPECGRRLDEYEIKNKFN